VNENRLMVMDDDPDVGAFFGQVRQDLGFEVRIVADPEQFGPNVLEFSPSVILLDLQMPGRDGIELLRELASLDRNPKVLIASGLDSRVLTTAQELGMSMGVDVAGSKLLAFVVGSFVAGIGGGVYAHFIGFLSPGTFSFIAGFNPLIIVVFGGLGSMTGTIAASFVWIFFLEGFLRVLLSQMGTEAPLWRFVLYPITLLLLMLIRPQGLLGSIEWGFLKPDAIIRRLKGTGDPALIDQKERA